MCFVSQLSKGQRASAPQAVHTRAMYLSVEQPLQQLLVLLPCLNRTVER